MPGSGAGICVLNVGAGAGAGAGCCVLVAGLLSEGSCKIFSRALAYSGINNSSSRVKKGESLYGPSRFIKRPRGEVTKYGKEVLAW